MALNCRSSPRPHLSNLARDLNLQYTYYLPILANRFDIASTLVDFVADLHTSGALAGNVPEAWRTDSSAAPTGASSLRGQESCYWSYGQNCTTSPPSVTGNLLWTLSVVHLLADVSGNATIDTEIVWPILGRALQFYSHFQTTSADGSIHLLPTFSPGESTAGVTIGQLLHMMAQLTRRYIPSYIVQLTRDTPLPSQNTLGP